MAAAADYSSSSDDDFPEDEEDLFLGGDQGTLGLFASSEVRFPSASACLQDARDKQGFDLSALCRRLRLDCFGVIRLVNYLRSAEGCQAGPRAVMAAESDEAWRDDRFMKPVIEDDPLLMLDLEGDDDGGGEAAGAAAAAGEGGGEGGVDLGEVQRELSQLRLAVREKESALEEALSALATMREAMHRSVSGDAEEEGQGKKTVSEARTESEDQGYARSYAHFGIHHEMLSDRPRTLSYRRAIERNAATAIRGRRVLDLGCGTGILSMFCARAGAKEVTAVDMSCIIEQAHDIRSENGLDSSIVLRKGRLEDLGLDGAKFDAIVSEWMGYFLLYEGMLDSVIHARDRHLAAGGRVLPNRCRMFLAGLDDKERYKEYVDFWDDVYGFKMSCMRGPVLKEAVVELVPPSTLATSAAVIHHLDLETCSREDTEFSSPFKLVASRDAELTSLAGYFDCTFAMEEERVVLSTAPEAEPTHWKQTVFYLREKVRVAEGQELRGNIEVARPKEDARALTITITLEGKKQEFVME